MSDESAPREIPTDEALGDAWDRHLYLDRSLPLNRLIERATSG